MQSNDDHNTHNINNESAKSISDNKIIKEKK